MDPCRPVLLVFHGGAGHAPAEAMVAAARVAATNHAAVAALQAGFDAVVVATDVPAAFADAPPGLVVDADVPGVPFDFGERLRGLVRRFRVERPAVMGSGALPLLDTEGFRQFVEALTAGAPACVSNNFFSADLTAWTPGALVERLGPLARDNVLPRRLRDEAGLAPAILPHTTVTQFDLDTPSDVAILALAGAPWLPSEAAAAVAPVAERYRRLLPILRDRDAELVVAGRVGSAAWRYLEVETACRVRMFSEERGMAAAGPSHRPRSLLGFAIEDGGVERFFARMAELGDALVLDARVIEAHLGNEASREDRFQCDLMAAAAIRDPFLRDFTAAALAAPIPVLLGGHSLVAGGLMALTDCAWAEHERRTGSPLPPRRSPIAGGRYDLDTGGVDPPHLTIDA